MDLVDWQQRFERWILTHHAQDDAAHDLSHFRRVWATATQLAAGEEVDRLVLLTACYFHDIVSLPKNHPERSRSSMMAAEKTLAILQSAFADFPADRYPAVSHAIEAHSFSAAIPPRTLEAKIVQDADRLESLGAIGLARVFAVAGALNTILFDAEDPFADRRALDDRKYALDHFQCKLLRLPETMQTDKGKAMAQHNARFLVEFMAKLSAELQGSRWRWMKRFCAALHRRRQPTGDLWYSLPKSSALVEDMPQKLSKEHRSLSLAEQAGEHAEALLRQLMTIYDVKTLVAELVSVGEQHWSAAILKRVAALAARRSVCARRKLLIWRRSCLRRRPIIRTMGSVLSICLPVLAGSAVVLKPSADSAFSPASGTSTRYAPIRPTGTVIRSSTVLMKISAILPSANALTLATRRRRGIFANLSLSMMCCWLASLPAFLACRRL